MSMTVRTAALATACIALGLAGGLLVRDFGTRGHASKADLLIADCSSLAFLGQVAATERAPKTVEAARTVAIPCALALDDHHRSADAPRRAAIERVMRTRIKPLLAGSDLPEHIAAVLRRY